MCVYVAPEKFVLDCTNCIGPEISRAICLDRGHKTIYR